MESELKELGKYRIDGILGEGGMGIVYKGFDPIISRTVAIKTIHSYLLEGHMGKELRARFRREVRAAGRLNHPNIITIYDYDESEGVPYFSMEFIEGKEVGDLLKQGRTFAFDELIEVACQTLSGLAYAHAFGIVHRDIKPANLILLDNSQIKIADFGIARIKEGDAAQSDKTVMADKTQAGVVLGSPRYMSPEQCLGEEIDARSDLYSVALVIYEMLTGRRAFSGSTAKNVAARIKNPFPDPPDKADKKATQLYSTVLKKALAPEPEGRYQSAEEFIEALGAFRPSESSGGLSKAQLKWVMPIVSIAFLGLIMLSWFVFKESNQYVPAVLVQSQSLPKVELSDKQKGRVSRLLKVAQSHHKVGRLVAPMGSNAFFAYDLVLKTEPGNELATNGVLNISNEIIEQLNVLVEAGELEKAGQLYTEALKAFPNHPELERLAETFVQK